MPGAQLGEVGRERRRVHRHEHVGRVAGRDDVVVGDVHLERRHSGDRAGWGTDLGGEVRHRRQVVAEGGADVGEAVPGELHAVAGVAGEADDDPVQGLGPTVGREYRWSPLTLPFMLRCTSARLADPQHTPACLDASGAVHGSRDTDGTPGLSRSVTPSAVRRSDLCPRTVTSASSSCNCSRIVRSMRPRPRLSPPRVMTDAATSTSARRPRRRPGRSAAGPFPRANTSSPASRPESQAGGSRDAHRHTDSGAVVGPRRDLELGQVAPRRQCPDLGRARQHAAYDGECCNDMGSPRLDSTRHAAARRSAGVCDLVRGRSRASCASVRGGCDSELSRATPESLGDVGELGVVALHAAEQGARSGQIAAPLVEVGQRVPEARVAVLHTARILARTLFEDRDGLGAAGPGRRATRRRRCGPR